MEESAAASDAWTEWATGVLTTHAFSSPRQRDIWRLYTAGTSKRDIAKRFGIADVSVYMAITRVKNTAPPPPVRHPRERGSTLAKSPTAALTKLCALAVRCADREQLRELVADDPELWRLLPQEVRMATPNGEKKAPSPVVRYERINIRGTVKIPGYVEKAALLDIEGRPHAGGIDVRITVEQFPLAKTDSVMTVPWWKIEQANRAVVE